MLCAANQIINHLDRLVTYSRGEYNPRVIIRVATPIVSPFNPGPQHSDDFSFAFAQMCSNIKVVQLHSPEDILREYQKAFHAKHSTILVEATALYGNVEPTGIAGK